MPQLTIKAFRYGEIQAASAQWGYNIDNYLGFGGQYRGTMVWTIPATLHGETINAIDVDHTGGGAVGASADALQDLTLYDDDGASDPFSEADPAVRYAAIDATVVNAANGGMIAAKATVTKPLNAAGVAALQAICSASGTIFSLGLKITAEGTGAQYQTIYGVEGGIPDAEQPNLIVTYGEGGQVPDISYSTPQSLAKDAPTTIPCTNTGGAITGMASVPTLPAGLSFSPDNSGDIIGTPTANQAATDYTITATNADGDSTPFVLSIEVVDVQAPAFTYPGSPYTATVGVPFSATPVETGGPVESGGWSVVGPALPDGLSIDADTGEISGTPTTPT